MFVSPFCLLIAYSDLFYQHDSVILNLVKRKRKTCLKCVYLQFTWQVCLYFVDYNCYIYLHKMLQPNHYAAFV